MNPHWATDLPAWLFLAVPPEARFFGGLGLARRHLDREYVWILVLYARRCCHTRVMLYLQSGASPSPFEDEAGA